MKELIEQIIAKILTDILAHDNLRTNAEKNHNLKKIAVFTDAITKINKIMEDKKSIVDDEAVKKFIEDFLEKKEEILKKMPKQLGLFDDGDNGAI